MNRQLYHILALLPLLAALASCSWNESLHDPFLTPSPSNKTPIELSVGGVDAPEAATRAVITDGTGKTLKAFDVNTKIFMVMKSEYGTDDYQGNHIPKYNVARGDVNTSENANNRSIVKFDAKNQRYWDDAHGRSSQLSIWAYAQKGQSTWNNCTFNGAQYKTDADPTQPYAWATTEIVPTILTWRASHQDGTEAQNQTSVQAQDLLFSNNLANYDTDPSTNPSNDKRLKFNFSSRKFPQVGEANMIFYHAMSKITINIIEGEGFDKTSANKANDFKFTTTGGNVILKQFNHTGTFDIKQGEFTSIASGGTTDIPSIYLKTTNTNATDAEPHYVLEALVVPSIANNGMSRFVDERKDLTNDVMMEFAIDNSLYKITHEELYEALKDKANATKKTDNGNYIPLEAGKNYVFTLTIGKTKVKNITAQVAKWEEVVASDYSPTNARINIDVEDDRGTLKKEGIDFYRANDNADNIRDDWESYKWETGYTTAGNKSGSTYHQDEPAHITLNEEWYWENNMTYYHFRTVQPADHQVNAGNSSGTGDDKCDYITLTASATGSYTDVKWGAPFKELAESPNVVKFKYNFTSGFDVYMGDGNPHQIYKAIGPTLDKITIIPFHMMSDVTIKLKTVTSNKAVTLEGATVKLVGAYSTGKVLMGNGKVIGTGELTTEDGTQAAGTDGTISETDSKYIYKYGAVPQNLKNVSLVIQTTDHNRYIVPMASIFTTTERSTNNNIENPYQINNGKYYIDKWYPGFKYVYELELTKTGIDNFRATIVDWEEVTADYGGIKIQ